MTPDLLLLAMLSVAVIFDIRYRRIPNALVMSGLAGSLLLHLFLPGAGGWQTWLLGVLTGFGVLLPFYLARGMGAGDVKLMAGVGAFVGPLVVLKIALATFLIGGVWSLVIVVYRGKARETLNNVFMLVSPVLYRSSPGSGKEVPRRSVGRLPYGVAIGLGTVAVLLYSAGRFIG